MLARVIKSTQIGMVALRQYPRSVVCSQIRQSSDKADEPNSQSEQKTNSDDKLGSFAKAFIEFEKLNETPRKPVESISFKKLLRESKLVDVSESERLSY